MVKYKIMFISGEVEEVEADTFHDSGHDGEWINFVTSYGQGDRPKLRVRASDVDRIDRIEG